MEINLYDKILEFLKKYPKTVAFRIRKHVKILEQHLNNGEKVLYVFPAQKSPAIFSSTCLVAFTNKRILIVQKRIIPGYSLNSITPDLFNDFQVCKSWFWGSATIDTAKELVKFNSIDSKALIEIETNLSEYLLEVKPKFQTDDDK